MNTDRLQKYEFENYTIVTNFETYQDAVEYQASHGGEMLEVGFTDGADNPVPNDYARLMEIRRPFQVGLDSDYEVIYSDDERFQKMAMDIQERQRELSGEVLPEDYLADQNFADGDKLIILKDGEINTVTTRERIKFLMRGNLYELAVKIGNNEAH